MALVVEDGTIVAGANSYVSLVDARAYATARGLVLSADDTVLEPQLIVAMDYLESLREKFQGDKTDITTPQDLQWPRLGVEIDGEDFGENAIPVELVQAQCRLAVVQEDGVDLFPTNEGKYIVKEKTGPLETTFSEKNIPSIQPEMSSIESLLRPLLDYKYRGSALRSIRV